MSADGFRSWTRLRSELAFIGRETTYSCFIAQRDTDELIAGADD